MEEIAAILQRFHPNDTVIAADNVILLRKHYREF
jgi:hypothetical protein